MNSPPRKHATLQQKTPRKAVLPQVTPDDIVDGHSSVLGTVVLSSKSEVNYNDKNVDVDEDVDNKHKVYKVVNNELVHLPTTDVNINDDEDDEDEVERKLKDLYEWIAPVPRVVDMSNDGMSLMYHTEVQRRESILLDPVMYYNVLEKLKTSEQDLLNTNSSENCALAILVSIYKLKRKRMYLLLEFCDSVPKKESLILEKLRDSCLSLIELEHTQKAIPSYHPHFEQFAVDFKKLFNSMEKYHNQLRKSLKGIAEYMFFYTPNCKWNDNYERVVKSTVKNQSIFEDSSSSMSSSSQQSSSS